jgi:rubredoxin
MDRYKCSICGHVYDPELGDLLLNLPAGIAFESLPADWQCPVCCACKDDFRKI